MALEQQIFTFAQWLLVAAMAWWLVGATLWIVALRLDNATVRQLALRASLPGSQWFARAMVAGTLAIVPACSPNSEQPTLQYLGEATTATTAAPAPTVPAPTSTPRPTTVYPSTTAPTPAPPDTAEVAPEPEATPADPGEGIATTHEVVMGEHFWAIAASHLETLRPGESPSNAEVARYWRRLINANADSIRSGNPNLIFPGEKLILPSLD